jgi:hypothetical protein
MRLQCNLYMHETEVDLSFRAHLPFFLYREAVAFGKQVQTMTALMGALSSSGQSDATTSRQPRCAARDALGMIRLRDRRVQVHP